jgi:TonB-dependent receptor
MKLFATLRASLTLTLLVPIIHAAETSTSASPTRAAGALTGRVQNVVTGQYLNNARVSVRGTELVTFTDQTGTYFFPHVPGGVVVLEVFYTGLDPQQLTVELPAGGRIERNVDLTSAARYGTGTEPLKLDSFVVAGSRETDGEAIAINEQRFAANIKNVVAADALGDLMDGNVGEFLKFMPGITAEYDSESGGSVASISVRGFPTNMAVVSSDGAEMATAGNPNGSSRVFQFSQVSINNISRLEVTKVPTPSSPADSMAGSVNMVTKSAFERKDAQLRYSVSLSANHEDIAFGKQPHTTGEKIYKILPSVSFDYTLPVTKNFGLVATGTSMNRFINQRRTRQTYATSGTGTGATLARPFLSTLHFATLPRVNHRHSTGLRADWRVTPHGVLSVNVEASRYISERDPQQLNFTTGTNGTPTPATGLPMTFGADFTNGATGRGGVAILGDTAAVTQTLTTMATRARYRFDNGDWRVEAGVGASMSYGGYQETTDGRFRQFGVALINPVRVTFAKWDETRPHVIEVYDNNNRPVDYLNLSNYRLTTANSQPRDIDDHIKNAKLDVRKGLAAFSVPATLQVGGAYRSQTHDVRRYNNTWNYNPPGGDVTPARYAATAYAGRDDGFGFKNMPWFSPARVFEAWQANPALFTQTAAQVVSAESARITNSEWLSESVSSGYVQGEAGLFRNRLRLLTGVRYESTTAEGKGPEVDPAAVWQRLPNGNFARTATGARIRRAEAGAVGSMQELLLTRHERAAHGKRTYDGFYPSVHLTYQIKENFLARAAYARTYGRPDFSNIVPNATIDEADLDGDTADPRLVRGRINVRNTGLRPWTGDNYDLSLEYYTDQGGLISAGVFLKEVKNFFGNTVRLATEQDLQELGLDPGYEGWELTTQFNQPGTSRVRGVEFNVRQSLRVFGPWGKYFQGFVNGTKLYLEGSRQADFSGFIPESASWGVTFSRKPISLMAKWNYRGKQKRGEVAAVDGFEYQTPRITLDLNLEYTMRRNLSLYATASNVFNNYDTWLRYGDLTPNYAKHYEIRGNGVQITAGIKGTF